GAIALSAASPIIFAVNTTSAGTLSATTTETASEGAVPLPAPDDDIIVNANVTVESTGGDVLFTAGDGIGLLGGSTVKSDTGNATSVTRDGAAPITFNTANTDVSGVTVTGGSLGDTFNVTPSPTVAFTVHGGQPTPPALPGDTLSVPAGGVLTAGFNPATGYSG